MQWVGVDGTVDGVHVGGEEVGGRFGDGNTVGGDDVARDVVVAEAAGEDVGKKGGWCGGEEGKPKDPAGAVGDPGPMGAEASVASNQGVAAEVEPQMSCGARQVQMEVNPKAGLMGAVEAHAHVDEKHRRTNARHLVGAGGVNVGVHEDGTGSAGVDEDDARGQADDSRCDNLFPYPAPCLSLGRGLFPFPCLALCPGSLSVQSHYSFCGPVPGHEVAVVGGHPGAGPVPCLVLGPKHRSQDDAFCLCPVSPFLSAFPFRSIPSPSPSVPFPSHVHSSPSLYGVPSLCQ